MSGGVEDQESWFSLFQYDIRARDVEQAGGDWNDVIPPGVEVSIDPFVQEMMPRSGWREVVIREPVERSPARRWFAAPSDMGWSLASLTPRTDGPGVLSAWPGPFRLRPSVSERRRGLRLEWSGPRRIAAADIADSTASLINASDSSWSWDPDDRGFVVGWLFDDDGGQSGPQSFAYGAYQYPLQDLDPGQKLELAIKFGPDIDSTTPGEYDIQVALPALQMRSERVRIVVA